MKLTRSILRYFLFTLLIACTSMTDLNKPEDSFEGNFLPIAKAIYNIDKKQVMQLLENSSISIDSVGKGGKSGKPTFLMYAVLLEKEAIYDALRGN